MTTHAQEVLDQAVGLSPVERSSYRRLALHLQRAHAGRTQHAAGYRRSAPQPGRERSHWNTEPTKCGDEVKRHSVNSGRFRHFVAGCCLHCAEAGGTVGPSRSGGKAPIANTGANPRNALLTLAGSQTLKAGLPKAGPDRSGLAARPPPQ